MTKIEFLKEQIAELELKINCKVADMADVKALIALQKSLNQAYESELKVA